MRIVLLHDKNSGIYHSPLSLLGDVLVLPGKAALQEYLLADTPCDLVVCALDGAAGMNCCITAHSRRRGVPILWISEQKEFAAQSKRIPVGAFMVKPVAPSQVFAAAEQLLQKRLLRTPTPTPILRRI